MSAKIRIAIAFTAIFFALGMHMPYFPVWLESRGYGVEAIGIVLAIITWMRVFANPLIGRVCDALGSVKTPAIVLSIGAALSYSLFSLTDGLWQVVAVAVLLGFTFSPLVPLTDSVAVRLGADGKVNYGQLRLWGSLAFIAASKIGGWVLERWGEDEVLATLRYAAVALVVAIVFMPRRGPVAKQAPQRRGKPKRSHVAFLCTTLLLHASHAMLYAFGTKHWRSLGVDDSTIGSLWSVGVIAEVLLFALSKGVQNKLSATGLLTLAAVGGVLRWPLLAFVTATPALFAIQILHAFTFAALHLGAMAYVQERVSDDATATVTSLYSASSGVGVGLAMLGIGSLYAALGGHTYAAMAVLSVAGWIGARVIARGDAREGAATVDDDAR